MEELPDTPTLVKSTSSSVSSQKDQETCFAHSATYLIFHNIYNIDLSEEDRQTYMDHNCNQYLDTTRVRGGGQVQKVVEPHFAPAARGLLEPNLDDLDLCGKTGKTRILLFLYIYLIITLKLGCNKGYVTHSIKYYLEGDYVPPFTSKRLNDELAELVKDKDLDLYTTSFVPIHKISVPHLKNIFDDGLYISLISVTPPHIITLVGMTDTEFIAKDSYEAAIFRFPISQFKSNGIIVVNSNFTMRGIRGLTFLYKKSATYPHFTREFEENYSEYASYTENRFNNEYGVLSQLGITIDKKTAISIVSTNGMFLIPFTPELKSDKEVVMAAVKNNGKALHYASLELKSDKEVVMAAVKNNGESIAHASFALKSDKEVAMVAIMNDGNALQYVSPELKSDKEVAMVAVMNDGYALQYVSPELKSDKEVVMVAVTQNGGSLFYASPELKSDKEVVMAAVMNDGYVLQHASPELKADKEVVMAAVTNNSAALQFASPELPIDVNGGRAKRRKRNKKTKKMKKMKRTLLKSRKRNTLPV
jgi:hypothetical protein